MGLREKVTITLVIIALTQIACRHCMPRTPRKASLKRYINDLKPVKNNPGSTAYSPSKVNKTPKQTFGKTAQNGRISQNSLPTKSLYDTYNFPENEYPLDNAPRDRFRIGMNFNDNNHVNTLQKARNLQSSAIKDLKKEMKMKRKLLSNKQANNENIPIKTDMSSIKIASDPNSVRSLDPETFPEVQYPLNTMETWGQNYWNYLPFTQEKQLNGLGQHGFNTKARESVNQPFTRLTKAKASKFLQSYDKLKEEHRQTSTENSKRSNVGQKGLNFTKTATCERVSDDFITASLFSNTLGIPSDTKTLDPTCSLIDNPCQLTPLPCKVIEENFENVCPTYIDLNNNTQELEDADSSVIAKTLQLIEEILLNDDISSKEPLKNKSKEKENNVNTTETDCSGGSANKDISINLIDNAETSTVIPIEELSHEISDDAQAYILPYNLPSVPEEIISENTTLLAGPLNVKTPVSFTEPITYDALTNASSPDQTNTTTLSNVNSVPGYTSIIIIPINNDAVGKPQSHIFETTPDKPIIVYLPSTQSSNISSQTPSLNHIVSSSLGNPVPNNQLYSDLSNMAPVQNDNPSSTALVSELLNSISDSGSSLPIHETLPTNSKCYNNENSPSSMREKPVSGILIHKSLIDETPFVAPNCNEKWPQLPLETDKFVVNSDMPPHTPDFEHPVFDFADTADIASLSQGPHTYNNVINNELPIIVREINSDHQITDTSSKDLVIAIQNITTGHLHKKTSVDTVSDDSTSESPNGIPSVVLDKDLSTETPIVSLEILKNHLSDSISNLSNHKSTSPSPTSKQSESSIDRMPPAFFVATPTVELPTTTEASLTPSPVFETFIVKLPEIMETRVPPTIVSDITSDRAPQPVDNTPGPSPISNSTPMTTDLIVKAELYKIRQILDRMLSSETSDANQPPSMNTTLPPIQMSTDRQPPPLDKVLSPIQTPIDSQPPPLHKVLSPIQTTTDSQLQTLDEVLSRIQTPTNSQPPPLDKVLPPISDTDSLPLLEKQSLSPIQMPTDSQPPKLDKVLSPIETPTDSQLQTLDEVLSRIQTPTNSQPPPLDKVLPPISDTDSLPLLEKQSLSPIQMPTDSQPPKLDKVLSPIQTPTDSQPPPLDKVLSPIQKPTDSQLQTLDKVLAPIQTTTDSQPPPLDKVLSPIQPTTDSQPPLLDKVMSPIQTPTDSQPPPLAKVLSPIQATTDSQPPPLDKVLSPIQKPTDSQLQTLEKQSLSPIQLPTDSQPPPLDKVMSPIQATTDSQPPKLDKVLSPIQTPTDSQPPPLDKVLSPIQKPTDSQLQTLEKQSLSPIQLPTDSQPPPLDKVMSPIQATTDSQPPPLDKVLSPIQTPTDSQLQTLDEVLSRIQTPTNSQPPPLDKVLLPISDTDSRPLVEKQSLSPIQLPTDSQPPPLDKVLSPIQATTDSQPPKLDKVLSPIQTPTDSQPPPLDKVLSPIQKPTDSQLQTLEKQSLSPIQLPTDSQPPPLDKVMSPIQATTDSQPPKLDKVLSPIQTTTDSQPPPLDKVMSPISDTDRLPLLENQSLSPTQTPADSVPLLAGDNMHLPLPVSDSPIDSSQQQDHKKLLKISINDVSKDTLPSPTYKSHLSNLVLDNIESPPQTLDDTIPPIALFETTIDDKTYLIENLVTPVYETTTSRTKDITNNGLPYKIDNSPLKMDLGYPDTYELYDDHLPLSIDDFSIKIHKENSKSPLSIVVLPTDEAEAPNVLSKTPVNDLLKPTEVLSLPVERVLEMASPGFSSDSNMILLNESMENEHQDFPPSKDVPNGFSALPTDEVGSTTHEVIPNSQSHEISSEIQPQKYDLPLPVDKLIPDISLSDALSDEPFVIDDSPSPIPDKIAEIPNSTSDTKHPSLVDKRLLSPEDYASPDTLVPDIPIAILPSLNEALKSTYLDKASDKVLSQFTLSDLHRDDLPLPASKSLPLPDHTLTNIPSNKTLSTSKLPITKALLESVFSDITKGVLSSQVAKALPVTPPSYKTVFYVYEKSPLSETKEIPLLPVENSFPNAEHNDNLIDNLAIPQITEASPPTNLPFEFPLPINYNDKLENSTDDAKGENETETQTSHNLSANQPLPKDKSSRLTDMLSDISRNEKSSSKLPITKALLENVLSEINTQDFPIPVSKEVPYISSSVLDKTHYNIDSPLSDFVEDSPPLPEDKILPSTAHTDNNLPFSGQSQDTSLEENKTLSEIQSIDISTVVSSSMDKIVLNDDLPSPVTEIIYFPKHILGDSPLSSYNIQTPSSPKLPIAKALLENVLSDINTKGLSMPVAKALPLASRSLLDKTLYFLESPRPATTKESDDHHSEINEDVLSPSADKLVPDNPIIDIPTNELISSKMYEDNSDDLTDEIETLNETLLSEKLTDDLLSEKGKSPDDIPDDLSVPPTKQVFSSRLPITKALLEKVLSDITEGAIAAKDPLNHPNL